MDFIFDFFVEVIFTIFVEGFVALASVFVPKKEITEKGKKIIGCVCFVFSILLFIWLLIGIAVLDETDGQSFWGWLPVSLSIVYLFVGIVLKIVSLIKK